MVQADHVRDWLKQLGALIAPSMSGQEFNGRINVLAPELAAEFPPDAYNPESCRHVARMCRFFPNYAEACEHLSAWWRQHRFVRLPEPTREARPERGPARTEEELKHIGGVVLHAVLDLKASALEKEARADRRLPAYQSRRGHLSRAELAEAYKRAGAKGPPRVPEPAQVIPLRRP